MTNPTVILTPIANDSPTKRLPPLTDSAAGIGRMSQEQGFPELTQVPLELGGKPPQRDDMNGALNLISQHTVFVQSGGQYLYDGRLTYDRGCVIVLDDGITQVQSLVDGNPDNPNAGLGATWRAIDSDPASAGRAWARRYAGAGIRLFASTVLIPEQVGNWVDVEAAAVVTTLPAVGDVPVGSTFVIRNGTPDFSVTTINSLGGLVGGEINFQIAWGELVELTADPDPEKGWWITSRSFAHPENIGIPIGAPIPWALPVPPVGWLVMEGQSFSSVTYPRLAFAYPSLVLPDLRGEFIRGWDNGRGVDPGRVLGSVQGDAIRNIYGTFAGYTVLANSNTSGAFTSNNGTIRGPTSVDNTSEGQNTTTFDASLVVPVSNENRPRNVAFNYICRAR